MIIKFKEKEWNLPKIVQYENYPYDPLCCCSDCSNNSISYNWIEENAKDVIGFCEVNGELMICCECNRCGRKYRFHAYKRYNRDFSFDTQYFFHHVGLLFYVNQDIYSKFEL